MENPYSVFLDDLCTYTLEPQNFGSLDDPALTIVPLNSLMGTEGCSEVLFDMNMEDMEGCGEDLFEKNKEDGVEGGEGLLDEHMDDGVECGEGLLDEHMEDGVECGEGLFGTDTQSRVIESPTVGMYFESMEAAKSYYLLYAHQQGFSIRVRNSQRRGKDHDNFTVCDYVCARAGKRTIQDEGLASQVKKRNTTTIRCECRARMRVKLQKDTKTWRVTNFGDEHDHEMVSPSKKVFMKTMKVMPQVACVLAEKFREVNLPVSKVPSVLSAENYGFNKRDCYNHLNSKVRMYKTPEDGDATAAYNYFKKKSVEDPGFFYAVQTDNESRAVNFFWVDGRSRLQYQYFGDVVFFDTTYRKNSYSMPFGPFTGLNHHFQCIQFGCALLLDETEESFV